MSPDSREKIFQTGLVVSWAGVAASGLMMANAYAEHKRLSAALQVERVGVYKDISYEELSLARRLKEDRIKEITTMFEEEQWKSDSTAFMDKVNTLRTDAKFTQALETDREGKHLDQMMSKIVDDYNVRQLGAVGNMFAGMLGFIPSFYLATALTDRYFRKRKQQ